MANVQFPNHLLTTNSIAVSYDNKHYMISKSAEPARYDALRAALVAKNLDAFIEALIPKVRIIKYSNEYFELDDKGELFMKDDMIHPVAKVLATRLVEFAKEDLPIEPLVLFWKKLRKNPSKNSQSMLYEFLEKNHHPITTDGNFLAYKKVTKQSDGKMVDSHSKKLNNAVGEIVSMPREKVVEDKNITCTTGLHVAAWDYAQGFSGNVLVEVIVDPTDVVSVPVDYNAQKMRVCRYKVSCVIGEKTPHTDNLKTDRDETGMKHKTDVKAAVTGKKVSFVALTTNEILDVAKSIVTKSEFATLNSMSRKNKQSIVKAAVKMLAGHGYIVSVDTPVSRTK